MDVSYASQLKHPVFKVLSQYATAHQLDVYVIGGWVRDLLMDRPSKDIDILVLGDGPDLARATAEILRVKKVSIFKNFGPLTSNTRTSISNLLARAKNLTARSRASQVPPLAPFKTTKIVEISPSIRWR